MHWIAHAAMTPSGVPPTPKRMSEPEPGRRHVDRAGDVAVGDQRDAGTRLAALLDDVGVALAVEDHRGHVADLLALRLGDGLEVGVDRCVDVDHVDGLRARRRACPCRRTDPGRTWCPARPSRSPRWRCPGPREVRVVPSMGSTAMSHAGPPLPISSPLKSMGASSFSPSPMTTTPSIGTLLRTRRIASTAAPSAPFLSPRPNQRPAASAAASVARARSMARLRSGA